METDQARKTFRLNEFQDRFIFSDERYSALFNEFGSGKSSAGYIKVNQCLWNHPKNFGIVIRNFGDDLLNSTIPQYFDLIYGSRYQIPDNIYYNQTQKLLRLPNGSELKFIAIDRPDDVRKLKNLVLGFFYIDQAEEIAEEVFTMLEGRLRLSGVKNQGFITGNPEGGDHWIKTKFYSKPINVTKVTIDSVNTEYGYWQGISDDFLGIVAKPMANKANLPVGYYERLIESYPREWLLKYVYSLWTGKTGMVYPFTDNNIIYEPWFKLNTLPKFAQVAYAQDYGISDTSPMVWLTIVKYDEKYYVIDEYYEYEQGIDAVNDYVETLDAIRTTKLEFTVGCPRTFQKEGTSKGKTPSHLFRTKIQSYPVPFESRQPVLAKLMEDERFFVFVNCENTIKEFKSYKWRTFKTAEDHAIEAIERAIYKFENVSKFDYEQLKYLPAGV